MPTLSNSSNPSNVPASRASVQDLCAVALCTAVTVIMAQISIPMPLGVPMTMQTFAVMLAAIILGAKKGAAATLVYMLLGSIGLPVFSNFTGGAQCLVGPTGGFILSFPLMAYIIGLGAKRYYERKSLFILSLIAGTAVNYLIGVLMFAFVTGGTLAAGFAACVMPFIPTTIIKMILAAVLGLKIRKRLPLSINNR